MIGPTNEPSPPITTMMMMRAISLKSTIEGVSVST